MNAGPLGELVGTRVAYERHQCGALLRRRVPRLRLSAKMGASANELIAFYDADRTRILIVAVIFGLAVLNLMWFVAAIRTTLIEAGTRTTSRAW
jgi:hypothetical protein